MKRFFRRTGKAVVAFFNFLIGYPLRFLAVISVHLLYRPKVVYVNKKAQGRKLKNPTLIISNHIYFIDGAVIGTVFNRDRIYTLAAKDLYNKKIIAWLLDRTRCIPIDRGSTVSVKWFHKSVDVLRGGHSLAIFPEGISSHNGVMRKFKPGFVRLAIEAGTDVLMVCQDGLYKAFRQRQWMMIGEPFRIEKPEDGVTPEYLYAVCNELNEKMLRMQKELQTIRYGEKTASREKFPEADTKDS